MSKMIIRLEDNGEVYRDEKHIATVKDGKIKFKHYSYKKHRDEIDLLLADDEEPEEETPASVDIGLEPITYDDETPETPLELFNTPDGKWYGEEAPEVVVWRSEHWSKRAFDEKYAHQEELLANNFAKCGMKYQPK